MNLTFIFVALLLVGLTLVLVFKDISAIVATHHQASLEVKRKKKPPPRRDQFPGDTIPGTAPGGATEDRSDEVDNV